MPCRILLAALSLTAIAESALNCSWWYEHTRHGFAYRNVTSFGAVGDGVADDTLAFQMAIDFNRGGDNGSNSDKSAAFVYVPPGRYKITDTLVLWKWTSLVGNPRCPPTLFLANATPGFDGSLGLRPFLVTNDGFNSTTSDHAWWLEDAGIGGATNENFFTQVSALVPRSAGGTRSTALLLVLLLLLAHRCGT